MEEPISSWFNCVQETRNLRTFHFLRCSEVQSQLGDLWSGRKSRFSFASSKTALRFVRSSTLTFVYAIVYLLFFLKKKKCQLKKNGDKRPNCFNGSYWLFLLEKEIILLGFTLRMFCHNSFLGVLLSPAVEVVNMHGPFVYMLVRWMLNWRDKNVIKVYV